MEKKYILNRETAENKLRRMALEIAEHNISEPEIFLLGIKESGSVIARKISYYLQPVFKGSVQVYDIIIDKKNPVDVKADTLPDISGKVVLLVDDVANSGRTMLYALRPLLDKYPKKIQTLALVERTYKSFPIGLDYIGLSISTAFNEHITVEVDNGDIAGAWLE